MELFTERAPGLRDNYSRLVSRSLPSWVIGILVAGLTWSISLTAMEPGIDDSWGAGLVMATKQGLNFGTDVVFTYGPLGFLRVTDVVDPLPAALAWLYQSTVFITLCVVTIEILRRGTGPWIAAALVILTFSLINISLADKVFVLAIGLVMLSLREHAGPTSQTVLIAGGGILAAIETLTKVSGGPLVLLVIGIGVIAGGGGLRGVLKLIATFILVFTPLWFITGQGLEDLGPYFYGSLEVASGYREAMTVSPSDELSPIYWIAAVSLALILVVSTYLGAFNTRRERLAASVIVVIISLVLIKQGTWRYGIGHILVCMSTLMMLWLIIPRRLGDRTLTVVSTIVLACGTYILLNLEGHQARVNLASNARSVVSGLRTVSSPERLKNLASAGRTSLKAFYGLGPGTLRAASGQRVAVDPWEIGVAWAYELEWDPLPTLQNYVAYTRFLDRINAKRLISTEGPTRILRPVPRGNVSEQALFWGGAGFYGRVPVWDPPAQQRAIYCNFALQARDTQWEVLRRVENRCGSLELLKVVDARYGDEVQVPDPGEDAVAVLRLYGAEVEGLENLWALLVHADSRFAIINGDKGSPRSLVPGTTTDGLMVRGGLRSRKGKLPSEIPQVRSLRVEGREGDLRYEFFRMPMKTSK